MANDSTNITSTVPQNTDKSLKEALADPITALTSILLLFLMVLILLGNAMVIRTVYATPKFQYPAFYFVVSLAVADLLIGFLVPVSLVYNVTSKMTGRWMAGEIACDIWTFCNIWFVVASLFNICVVSWDRYKAVTSPLTYRLDMRGKKVKILITMVWSVSLVFAVLYTVAFELSEERRLCITNGLSFYATIFAFVVIYVIPTLFLIFVNGRVLLIARKHRHEIQIQELSTSNLSVAHRQEANKFSRISPAIINELKTFQMFMVVIGTFVICWTPFFVLLILQNHIDLPYKLPHVTVILFYVKSGLNPLIYGTHDKELRNAAVNSLKRRRRIESNVSKSEPNNFPNELRESGKPIPNEPREHEIVKPNELQERDKQIPNELRQHIVIPNELLNSDKAIPNELRENEMVIPNEIQDRDKQIPNELRGRNIQIQNML